MIERIAAAALFTMPSMTVTSQNIDAQREALRQEPLPRSIAIIMDGNGRWAEQHHVPRAAGHEAGAKSVRAVVEACRELQDVESLALYAFSTENWRRSEDEVGALFSLLSKYVRLELENIHRENIRVHIIGRREGLGPRTLKDLDHCEERTRGNTGMDLFVAVNYGGRAELVDAARRMAEAAKTGALDPAAIDEETFAAHLYHPKCRDVDLLVRTSGEMRISNFMLWQASYAEIVSTPTLWPDFRKPHLYDCIAEYQRRNRRFGGR